MLASIPGFSRTLIFCKQKFNAIYKQYNYDKIANENLGIECHECPFYDALNSWWHQSGNVMKHVSTFFNETKKIVGNPKSKVDFDSASKDEGSKELMEKPFTLDEVKNITKNKSLMCMNIFQS
jgi:hypothetical protein